MSFYRLAARRACPSSVRYYSRSQIPKSSLQLVAELRRRTDTSISKAREALVATNNDLNAALKWLQNDLAVSGAKKAEKVQGREMKEGLIGVSILSPGYGQGTSGVRAAMVELNCETDFVGRNELFGKLVSDVAHSTAYHAEASEDFQSIPTLLRPCAVDALLDAPYLQPDPSQSMSDPSKSIGSAIRDTIGKIGENISLRRAVSVVLPAAPDSFDAGIRVASYVHGSAKDASLGSSGTLALVYLKSPKLAECFRSSEFRTEFGKLERALARQIVGFNALTLRQTTAENAETALYEQQFSLYPGKYSDLPIKAALQLWAMQEKLIQAPNYEDFNGIAVSEFVRWSVGQDPSLAESAVVSCEYKSVTTVELHT